MAPSDLLIDLEATPEPDQLRHTLAREVRRTVACDAPPPTAIVRLTAPAPSLSPLSWLDEQPFSEKGFWAKRGGQTDHAWAGIADLHTGAADEVLPLLQERMDRQSVAEGARYYGGLRFDSAGAEGDHWQPFGTARFVLPRFVLRHHQDATTLACHLVLPRDKQRLDEVLAEIERLRFPDRTAGTSLPLPIARDDAPDALRWHRMVTGALDQLRASPLDKVVLARRTTFRFDAPLSPWSLLGNLRAATPHCFHFAFHPSDQSAFVGASPERLFHHDGRKFESEAVAGTRPRSADPAEDERLARDLLESSKDRREHAFVQAHLQDELAPLSATLTVDETPSDMKLARGRHLRAGLRGTLRSSTSTADLLAALHPTPAVGGTPRPRALALIRSLEPFDRGWYAGPVGWISPDAADFAVAIRSGLVARHRLALFSGAGIVNGSEPEKEWDEIEQKIADFTSVLGLSRKTEIPY